MTIQFLIRYETRFGETLYLDIEGETALRPLEYLSETYWTGLLELDPAQTPVLRYRYQLRDANDDVRFDWEADRNISLADLPAQTVTVHDYWGPADQPEHALTTQPFRDIFFKKNETAEPTAPGAFTHIFKVRAPQLRADEVVCLCGHGPAMRNWDTAAPLLMHWQDGWWTLAISLAGEAFPLGYKYGIWNTRTHAFAEFESGTNRVVLPPLEHGAGIQHDGFARFPFRPWRGAGVAIPVFSLRSEKSYGIGEFTDLKLLADWAAARGMKLIQLLPINDTTATYTRSDSYPYAAISAFALHPVYLNLEEVAGKKHAAALKPFSKKQKTLNSLPEVDYEAVIRDKWDMVRALYPLMKADWLADREYQDYLAANRHWLAPYAVFCYLRDKHGTSDFSQWPEHRSCDPKAVDALLADDEVAIHLFVQWRLHRQLREAVDYVHAKGLAMKGDIPIGIYRYSCDAWVAPDLYNMDWQAGAPPDDFAVAGQNWGFPTYNWTRMKEDGFAWWRQRFQQMSLYFDAFRIDHILGFFRIWSIPIDAVQGIMGRFVPALPVWEREFHERGIGFSFDRLCRPFISGEVLREKFGEEAEKVAQTFLDALPATEGWPSGQYRLKSDFDTQRKIENWFGRQKKKAVFGEEIRDGLYDLASNVILFPDADREGAFHFRINMGDTLSYRYLPDEVKGKLRDLYTDYFFRRQDDFWEKEALEKLPALKKSTDMLICGEDLGMVPACVPGVMRELGLLSLEIQRMPKQSGQTFFHPREAPYLSVVTPSTHDMSTIRGWWEENRDLSQRFFNEVLGMHGAAPWFCEPWLNEAIVRQHLYSPAMWSIFQLQDLMGIDGALRRENPHDERINIPADPRHYWRYRMHLTLEQLAATEAFNRLLEGMIRESGR